LQSGLDNLIGLSREKQRFRVQLARCKQKNLIYPHTLLFGVGGTGKTALARAMADELQYHLIEVEAAELKNRDCINDLLIVGIREAQSLGKTLFLFIDEIHRLTAMQQEALYYPMKEWRIITLVHHKRNITP
jgi:Holliday junction resolvasome RuvABC ATP-dependent DNA helicase subunit